MSGILKYLVIIIFSLSVFGCDSTIRNKTVGVWKLSGVINYKMSNIPDSVSYHLSDEMKDYVQTYYSYSFINFYSNTDCIIRKGSNFIQANWKLDETGNNIIAKSKGASDENSNKEMIVKLIGDSVKVLFFKPDSNIVSFYKKTKGKDVGFASYIKYTEFVFLFKKELFEYEEVKDDIYSLANNSWRIKPNKPETKEQIRARLKASVNYTRIFLNDAVIRGNGRYNTRALIAPIKIYNNSIGTIEKEKLLQEWIEVFYNKEQALQAWQMLYSAFDNKLKVNKKGNWILTDIDLLNQLCEKL